MEAPNLTRNNLTSDPLPMKQRALPQSFWQQPNVANPQPPGVVCSALPALPLGGTPGGGVGGVVGPGDDGGVDITPVEEVASQLQGGPTGFHTGN